MSNEGREALRSSAVGRRLSSQFGFAALAAVMMGTAMPAPAAESPARRSPFAPVPRRALVELKATVGREFSSGLVFVNGRFIAPPYKVERYGTALRVNGVQATGEIVPWNDFLKTQSGVRIEKTEHPAPPAPAPAAEPMPEPEPEPEPEPAATSGDDLDDLFADDPVPKKVKKPAPRPVRRVAAPSAPPPPTVNYSLDGQFVPNDRTKAMVERINRLRTNVEVTLRKGGCIFFGTGYSMVSIDRAPADMFLDAMPDVMRTCATYELFSSVARAKGIAYLSDLVLRDLFRNRTDYPRLQARAKAVREERRWEDMLKSTR